MTPETLQQLIAQSLPQSEVVVQGDGSKFEARIVSPAFEGLSTLKRHQAVYKILGDYITSGEIHALSMKTLTPEEAGAD